MEEDVKALLNYERRKAIDKLNKQVFYLEMKDKLTSSDKAEIKRLNAEIKELEKELDAVS